jgi:hypothetical protein
LKSIELSYWAIPDIAIPGTREADFPLSDGLSFKLNDDEEVLIFIISGAPFHQAGFERLGLHGRRSTTSDDWV